MAIDEEYASPLMRWALLREDHPGADFGYSECLGSQLPDDHALPSGWGGDDEFVLATITFPPETGLPPAYGYKRLKDGVALKGGAVGPVETVEQFLQLRTKCLGRALSRAGYPSNMTQLRAVIRWRKELARIDALIAGVSPAAIAAWEQAAVTSGTGTAEDAFKNAGGANDSDDDVIDGEVIEPGDVPGDATPAPPDDSGPPDDDTVAEYREVMNATSKAKVQGDLRKQCQAEGISFTAPETADQMRRVIDLGKALLTTDQEVPTS